MVNLLAAFVATMITIPILTVIIIYWLSRVLTNNKKRAFHLSVDLSTPFFIIAVHYLIVVIWGKSFLWILLILLMSIALLFVFLQWKMNQEIVFRKVWKGFWRLTFLLFFIAYFVLIVIGLIERLSEL